MLRSHTLIQTDSLNYSQIYHTGLNLFQRMFFETVLKKTHHQHGKESTNSQSKVTDSASTRWLMSFIYSSVTDAAEGL